MSGAIKRVDEPSSDEVSSQSDEVSSQSDAANPWNPAPVVKPKRPTSGKTPAATPRTRKTNAGASTPKRRKPFVL
jgi:hypothetical protein